MIQGACLRASANISRTRLAPTPTNISTKSEPEMVKNGTPASPATARARSVLPVPGGPTSKAPVGIRAPRRVKRDESCKNSTTSLRSSLAASTPATSSKVTRLVFSVSSLALDLPKFIAPPRPPLCILRKNSTNKAAIIKSGKRLMSILVNRFSRSTFLTSNFTLFSLNSFWVSVSYGLTLTV